MPLMKKLKLRWAEPYLERLKWVASFVKPLAKVRFLDHNLLH